MFSTKYNILYCVFINVFVRIHGLVELPPVEDNNIAITESAVRNTINSLFSSLKLKHVKDKARFGEFAAIHNFFATITLQDHDNLKEIARLATVNNIDNKTQVFITQLNEVLNEDNKSDEATDDIYVTTYIEAFIKKLEYLKQKFGFNNNTGNFDINTNIINHIRHKDALKNLTKPAQKPEGENLLSDVEFWQPDGRRVFEGRSATIKRFPFMASVQFFKKFQCGGSIIKSDLVITSASCLQLAYNNRFFRENPAFLSVQVGCDRYEGGDENIPILEVYFHPEYNPKNLMNNLAILRLQRILKFGKNIKRIKKIDFDRDAWPLPQTTPGITIVGWGAKRSSNVISDIWSNRLSFAELDFYPLAECQEIYSKDYVTFRNFCAGFFSKGGGACNRDVGGPGIAHGVLVGVISFGSPNCGSPNAPTVFTKVGYYAQWIEEVMEQCVPHVYVRTTERSSKGTYNVAYPPKATTFSIKPIGHEKMKLPIPIKDIESLRTLEENRLFKDFLTTMFGSEEVKEYLDQYEYEEGTTTKIRVETSKEITRERPMSITEASTKSGKPGRSTTEANKEDSDEQVGSVKMVTSIDNFDRYEEGSIEAGTVPSAPKRYTVLDDEIKDKNRIEDNIAKLINDIDIQEFLKSSSSESSSESDKETEADTETSATIIHKPVRVSKNIEREKKEQSEESEESSSYDEDSEESLLTLIDMATNNEKENKVDVKDEGLTIPKTPSSDYSNKEPPIAANDILNLLSQDDLMKILTEAVATANLKRNL